MLNMQAGAGEGVDEGAGEGAGEGGGDSASAASAVESTVRIGGRSDEVASAWRTAIAIKPDMTEAMQMLSMRLSRAKKKKTRAAAVRLAKKALKLDAQNPMSYVALGLTLSEGHGGQDSELKDDPRQKAIAALRTALEMPVGGLSRSRAASTYHLLGSLTASKKGATDADGAEALRCFKAAAEKQPGQPKYAQSVKQMEGGIVDFQRQKQAWASKQEQERLQKMEEDEDAEWEADEAEGGFSDIR
jgi:hypothetical protein